LRVPAPPIRVLLVDDHVLVLWALERLFEIADSGFVSVGKTGSTTEAMRLVRETRPDVVLLGLDLGAASVSLIPKLLKQRQLRIVAMSAEADPHLADRAVLSGARGLLRKEDSTETIVKAIRKVHAGELWLDRATSGRIFGMLTQEDEPADPDAEKIASLTRRERNIVATLAGIASARHKEVASLLGMSEHTLRNHLSKIYGKLELSGHFELYLYAKRHGLDQLVRD
jgi:DNA-binding NarL/FixJ family response regulator